MAGDKLMNNSFLLTYMTLLRPQGAVKFKLANTNGANVQLTARIFTLS